MLLAVDVYYRATDAKAVAILFEQWIDQNISQYYETIITELHDYIPGEFYKRELPCIIEALKPIDLQQVDFIIIDGYVYLNDDGKPGLGHYVYEYYNQKIPVIGVAKSNFHNNQIHMREVYRGESKNPLYITSIGIDIDQAKHYITMMFGEYRMPYLLKLLDRLTKS
ncbi:MAG: endonuclease V [Saprospiraceae bacterium]